MIQTRNEIFGGNSVLAQYVLDLQKARYGDYNSYSPGQSVILDDDENSTTLTIEQAAALNNEDRKWYEENCDQFVLKERHKFVASATLVSSQKESSAYLNDVSKALIDYSKQFNLGKLLVLGVWTDPWLNPENDCARFVEALDYFGKFVDSKFAGGFFVEEKELPNFIPHLFCLTRYNALLPDYSMAFEHSKTILTICRYGVIHLEFYDTTEKKQLLNFFLERNFLKVDSCQELLDFG